MTPETADYSRIVEKGTWTIRILDDSDLVNSDLIIFSFGQFGPRKVRSKSPKVKWFLGPN